MIVEESSCKFIERDNYKLFQIDICHDYIKSSYVCKSVDFILCGANNVILVEVKCYDFFKREGYENKLIEKLKDTIFFMLCCSVSSCFLKCAKDILSNNIVKNELINYVIVVCPPHDQRFTYDRQVLINEVLNRRLKPLEKLMGVRFFIDTIDNNLQLFSGIERL